jgi:folylpolyglutamate synthase/dihydropteroate synthase
VIPWRKSLLKKRGSSNQKVPVVIGETIPETAPVFEKTAEEKNSPYYLATAKEKAINRNGKTIYWKWRCYWRRNPEQKNIPWIYPASTR